MTFLFPNLKEDDAKVVRRATAKPSLKIENKALQGKIPHSGYACSGRKPAAGRPYRNRKPIARHGAPARKMAGSYP